MDEARKCDVVGFIIDGKLIAEGSPDQVVKSVEALDLEDAFIRYVIKRSGGV